MDRESINEIIYTPTVRCNLNCKHCGEEKQVRKEDEIACSTIYDELISSRSIATRHLVCSGGEPFLNEDFATFCVSLIKKAHWTVSITTNGFFTNRIASLIEELGDYNKSISFALSIDGLKDTHNAIRMNPFSFDHACETLKLLCNHDVSTQINTVVQNDNIAQLAKLKEFIFKCTDGKAKNEFIPITIGLTGISENENSNKYNKAFVDSIWNYIDNPYFKLYCLKEEHLLIKKGCCRAGSRNIFIGADGRVYTCVTGAYYKKAENKYVIGNLNNNSLDEIWNSDNRKQVIKEQVITCQGCNNYCEISREIPIGELFSSITDDEFACYMSREKENVIFAVGWHNEECDIAGNKFRWMAESEAIIFIKESEKVENIELHCFNNSIAPIGMSVYLGEKCIGSYNLVTTQKLMVTVSNNKCIRVKIKIDRCWRPCDEYDSVDARTLGIGVYTQIHHNVQEDNDGVCYINVTNDKQIIFTDMEQAIKKSSHIVIENNTADIMLDSCIDAFIRKYKRILRKVDREYLPSNCEITNIYTRTLEVEKSKHYKEILQEYDSAYYLEDCGGYDTFLASNGTELSDRLQQILNLVNPKQGDNIFDIGCGRGELAFSFASHGAKVLAIDYSTDAIGICENTYGKSEEYTTGFLKYICGDVLEVDEEVKYNKIVMADVYEHIESEVIELLLKKISRILSDDGVLFIHTAPNLDWYRTVYSKHVHEARKRNVFLPNNPRSRYEELMHINEQSLGSLNATLKKYFSNVIVWSGKMDSLDKIDYSENYEASIDLTALVSNGINELSLKSIAYGKELNKNEVDIVIKAEADSKMKLSEKIFSIDVTVRNLGNEDLKSQYPYPVYLSYHLLSVEGTMIRFDNARFSLGRILRTGEQTLISMIVDLEDYPSGGYCIEVDLVQENQFWFKDVTGNSSCFFIEV